MATTIARITSTEDFLIADELYEVQPSFDDSESIDDAYELDDTYSIDDTEGLEELFSYLFDITVTLTNVDEFQLLSNGKLMVNELIEDDKYRNSHDGKLTVKTFTENNAF